VPARRSPTSGACSISSEPWPGAAEKARGRPGAAVEATRGRILPVVRGAAGPGARRHTDREGRALRAQSTLGPVPLPRGWQASAQQQRQRASAAPSGNRKGKLPLPGQRPGGRGQHDLRLAAGQLPAPQDRAVGLPAGSAVPAPPMEAAPRARARTPLLEPDPAARAHSAVPRRESLPPGHARPTRLTSPATIASRVGAVSNGVGRTDT